MRQWKSVMKCLALCLLVFLACRTVPVRGSHILCLFVDVHRSQLLVHLAVARVLLRRGHQLTLVTSLPLEDSWLNANVTHHLLPRSLQQQSSLEPNADFLSRTHRTLQLLERSGELLQQPAWHAFMHTAPATPFDLMLLGYHFNDHLLGVAAHFQCPVVIVTTQQPIGFVHSLMGNPEERSYVPQPYDSKQRTGRAGWVFGLWEKLFEWLARRIMSRVYSTHFPSPQYPSFETVRNRVALALNNHHMISEGPIAPLLPSMVDIGGIVLEQTEKKNLTFPRRPFILFSLGTRFSWQSMPAQIEQATVAAFAQLADYHIYWTYDGTNASAIHAAYPHVHLAKWWPQAELLGEPLVRLFITHGGKGSISEALYHGVPLLGLPMKGDQRPNLRKVEAKGWGLTMDLQTLSHAELLSTIQRLLDEPHFKRNIEKASRLYRDRPMSASDLTAYWVEYVIRHKGAAHLAGTAKQLSFWQRHLVDVRLAIYLPLFALCGATLWLDRRLNFAR